MQIRIRYFAALRETVGISEETITLPDASTLTTLRIYLSERYPTLPPILERSTSAVNRRYAPLETRLQDGDEIVFIPPTGGGR